MVMRYGSTRLFSGYTQAQHIHRKAAILLYRQPGVIGGDFSGSVWGFTRVLTDKVAV